MTKLTITGIAHDLRGVGRHDGCVWFVDGALPDELVEAREIQLRQQRVDAELLAVVKPSPLRVQPLCEYYRLCGGCSLQHLAHEGQVALKQQVLLEQLKRMAGVAPVEVLPPLLSESWHYRRRTKLSTRWSSDRKHLAIGFRHNKDRQIIEIDHCAILEPALEHIIMPLRQCLSAWRQPAKLGHINLVYEQGVIHLGLRTLTQPAEQDVARLLLFASQYHVAVFLEAGEEGDVTHLEGTLTPAPGFYPGDFLQGNAKVNDAMVSSVKTALDVTLEDSLLEAFCGLGNFTFSLAGDVNRITALEIDPGMVSRATAVAHQKGITTIAFRAENLESSLAISALSGFSKVLLDPPRQGARHFCEQVDLKGVERLVYVSCNPSTLARDAVILCGRGLSLVSIQFVDMFAQTSHIEAIALFMPQSKMQKADASVKKPAKGRRIKPFSIR